MSKNQTTTGKFIDPLTDYGFKHYFFSEHRKDILIAFLNGLFEGQKHIEEVEYIATEYDGDQQSDRKVVYDLTCRGSGGEIFVIEVQRIRQEYFKDRAIYYTSRLIHRQLEKGSQSDSYRLPEVYLIALLEFRMEEGQRERYFHDIALCNRESGEIFYNKLGFKFLELVNFAKEGAELKTAMDEWLYILKNLSTMDRMPAFLNKRIFKRFFGIAEVSKLTKEEHMSYEASLKARRDYESAINTIRKEGELIGEKRGMLKERAKAEAEKHAEKLKSAKHFLSLGLSAEDIAKAINLPLEDIENLK